jgi:hypothetical protein
LNLLPDLTLTCLSRPDPTLFITISLCSVLPS